MNENLNIKIRSMFIFFVGFFPFYVSVFSDFYNKFELGVIFICLGSIMLSLVLGILYYFLSKKMANTFRNLILIIFILMIIYANLWAVN